MLSGAGWRSASACFLFKSVFGQISDLEYMGMPLSGLIFWYDLVDAAREERPLPTLHSIPVTTTTRPPLPSLQQGDPLISLPAGVPLSFFPLHPTHFVRNGLFLPSSTCHFLSFGARSRGHDRSDRDSRLERPLQLRTLLRSRWMSTRFYTITMTAGVILNVSGGYIADAADLSVSRITRACGRGLFQGEKQLG